MHAGARSAAKRREKLSFLTVYSPQAQQGSHSARCHVRMARGGVCSDVAVVVQPKACYAARASSLPCCPAFLRSLTMHHRRGSLVTQLTANPDITKFSLPAVFLYPYTVLELGAFRALRHQSELLRVKDVKDPMERLLLVTRWFLSAMERMETMNKKPFNPVLGEELNAWVDDPVFGRTVLKAEQVSHHPPVSACVMVNKKHGLQFCSNVKFGITFNGNSVSCRLEGRATVTIVDLVSAASLSVVVTGLTVVCARANRRRSMWRQIGCRTLLFRMCSLAHDVSCGVAIGQWRARRPDSG